MNRQRFLKHVRQYAALTQRTGKNYSDMIVPLVGSLVEAENPEGSEPVAIQASFDWASQAVRREFGSKGVTFDLSKIPDPNGAAG